MRLTGSSIRATGAAIALRFEGREIAAIAGETVAAALSAAGVLALRAMPDGAPRGLHCGMGACQDCVVTIDGRHGQRACQVKAADGMEVSGAAPAALRALCETAAETHHRACDVLVLGAGPAGLAAAIAAAEAGAGVVVLDERDAPGGQYHKPLAPSHAAEAPPAGVGQSAG